MLDEDSCTELDPGCAWRACYDARVCAGGYCMLPPCSLSAPDGGCPPAMGLSLIHI